MIAIWHKSNTRTSFRNLAVILLDATAAAASLVFALYLRVGQEVPDRMEMGLSSSLPILWLGSLALFYVLGLHRRVWRYTSLTDLVFIIEAVTLTLALFLLSLILMDNVAWMPRSLPIIQWFVLVTMLGGTRMARRLISEYRRAAARPEPGAAHPAGQRRALLVGPSERVGRVLALIEANPDTEIRPVGILDIAGRDMKLKMRGVPVLGSVNVLEHVVEKLEAQGRRPDCLIVTEAPEDLQGPDMVKMVTEAESLGLKVACLPKLAELGKPAASGLDLRFLNVAELLGRPQAKLDPSVVGRAIAGRRVLVTGAGGTIGRELVRQIAAFNPGQLILLEASEFNLYDVDLEMQESFPKVPRAPVLCSIRQRQQVMRVFSDYQPELVFHAAALKHVPLVEQHPCAGVQTNVLGTRNVADAARRYRVKAMVQVSTDKAVNPVGLMGATKRLGELYCQALDLEGQHDPRSSRFLTVRFGNVLGSSGSLIPLFQRQLSRGQPLTVTHPEITRYFMTVHEAVQLILQSTARGLEGDIRRGRIFVLDMGEPIRIIDVARRMIRLSGRVSDVDKMIKIVGLRPGEKLYEELFDEHEQRLPSTVEGLFEAEPIPVPLSVLRESFDNLASASFRNDVESLKEIIARLLRQGQGHYELQPAAEPEMRPTAEIAQFPRPMPAPQPTAAMGA